MRNFRDTRTNVVRLSHDGRATVLRQHAKNSRLFGEKIKLSDIGTNVVPHSHECRAIVVRIKNKNKIHSRESRETLSRMSRDCRATVARLSRDIFNFKIRPKLRICRTNVYSMRLQHENNVYIVNLCREIFAN